MPSFRQARGADSSLGADMDVTFELGQMLVRRSGSGAMQLAGPYAFGPPPDRASAIGVQDYDVFDQMHYVCFHFEFEHHGNPDVECTAGGRPAAGIRVPSRNERTDGVDLVTAAHTVVPAILALEANGFTVTQEADLIIARAGNTRFAAQDPVAVLGLVKLAETRRPWRADDAEIDDVLGRFSR
jgi:hypothetical protein